MINTFFVQRDTQPDELKKAARKLLMTGGAVIRLDEALNSEECEGLLVRFRPEADRFNLAGEVLRQLARSQKLSATSQNALQELGYL